MTKTAMWWKKTYKKFSARRQPRFVGRLGFHYVFMYAFDTVKLGDKERFDKEQIGVKEPFPVTNCQFTS
jgi:hypothetical protein